MRYKKAPILEAVLAFSWSSEKSLDELKEVLSLPAFERFDEPKPRIQVGASIDVDQGQFSHQQKQLGFEVALRNGSEIVFLEQRQFVFVQRAPYDRWAYFSEQATSLVDPVIKLLEVDAFERIGLRFVNRIDIPSRDSNGINTDDYVTFNFNGPREDRGIIEEFQMRVVKPTEKAGIHYALVLATTAPPMPDYVSILLDIDVFTKKVVPSSGIELTDTLDEMRIQKNHIFEECLTNKARELFGGVEK
ncbi:TIGR04255 family protein [Ruegeria atlantica]|uniref:TIGR04255 family protein n=1 Tax=Ruegeria atlantica TaxID=81569 RepID=UPI00147BB55A